MPIKLFGSFTSTVLSSHFSPLLISSLSEGNRSSGTLIPLFMFGYKPNCAFDYDLLHAAVSIYAATTNAAATATGIIT